MTDLCFIRTSSRTYIWRLLCSPPWQSRRRQRRLYERSSHSPSTSQHYSPIRSRTSTGAEPSGRSGIVPQPTIHDRSSPSSWTIQLGPPTRISTAGETFRGDLVLFGMLGRALWKLADFLPGVRSSSLQRVPQREAPTT